MSAVWLARLRALSATGASEVPVAEPAARAVGRTLVRAGSRTVLARDPEAPSAADLGVDVSTPPDSALVALGLCVGLAWVDRDSHPYPGGAFTISDLTTAARRLGVSTGGTKHLVGAVRHLLAHAGFVEIDDLTGLVHLGPAVAGWSDVDLDALRRNLDALPEPRAVSS